MNSTLKNQKLLAIHGVLIIHVKFNTNTVPKIISVVDQWLFLSINISKFIIIYD